MMCRTLLAMLMMAAGLISFAMAEEKNTGSNLVALCYHDVRDDVRGRGDPDAMAVSTRHLAEHFEWLRVNGYTPVTLDQIDAAKTGESLPKKPILLTFDDGYASFYHEIFPLLRRFNYPAVMALVGSWLEVAPGSDVVYGDGERKPRENFLTALQIREMASSGLIEFASHTYDLHRGVIGNPQQNRQPAAATRQYFSDLQVYETDEQYHQRIRSDLNRNHALLEQLTGYKPRTMVWPYGEWSIEVEEIAREVGYEIFLTLDNYPYHLVDRSGRIGRLLIVGNPTVEDLKFGLESPAKIEAIRASHIDLDYVYDDDKQQQRKNLDALIDRIKAMRINTVFLQAFADPDGDGNADALYFPNSVLPVRDDLFNRVSWQLETRAGVSVYAWMPVASFDVNPGFFEAHGVRRAGNEGITPARIDYRRLSIFDPESVALIGSIYDSLGKYTHFDGVLFHDDAYFSDFEDMHPEALRYYKTQGINFQTVSEIHQDESLMRRWTDLKVDAWNNFTDQMMKRVRYFRSGEGAPLRSARNLYASVALNPESEQWFAQSLLKSIQHYDHVALMAMPYMENAADPQEWLADLYDAVNKALGGTDKVIFELQTRDWRNQTNIPTETLVAQFRQFYLKGAMNVAYYPDDFLNDHPKLEILRPGFSTENYPYRQQ